jgi:hypothetical protein
MQFGEFLVPTPYVGIGRGLRHFAAMAFTPTMIGHLIAGHDDSSLQAVAL